MGWLVGLFSLGLGFAAVLQGGINRHASGKFGLTSVILLNNAVIFVAGLALFAVVKFMPANFPDFFKPRAASGSFSWWYILPGLLGLCLVAGIPFAISKIGALRVFVGIVTGQMIVSMIWDACIEGIPVTTIRLASAGLTIAGVVLLSWK